MAKKNYKITLTLTNYGASGDNPNTMETRIALATGAAARNKVMGRNGTSALNGHVHRDPPTRV